MFKVTATCNYNSLIAKNVINSQFIAKTPLSVLVSDIASIQTKGFTYQKTSTALADRKITGSV